MTSHFRWDLPLSLPSPYPLPTLSLPSPYPLPTLSPRRCKQGWYNARGEGLKVRGHARFMQP